jgi:DNA-binding SARP family transcriptional activator
MLDVRSLSWLTWRRRSKAADLTMAKLDERAAARVEALREEILELLGASGLAVRDGPEPSATPLLGAGDADPPSEAAPAPPDLAIWLLGPLRIELAGRPVPSGNGQKGQRVLRYLLARGSRPLPRDVLLDTFWPDLRPEAARRNLHQSVYTIRRMLASVCPDMHVIVFEHESYLLDPSLRVWRDTDEFDRLLRLAHRASADGQEAAGRAARDAAAALYRGDYLEDTPYEDWALSERDRLRGLYLQLENARAADAFRQGDLEQAVALCHVVLDHDACDEDAHRLIMRVHAHQGQHHQVVQQYRSCVTLLDRRLGLRPSPETTALFREIVDART